MRHAVRIAVIWLVVTIIVEALIAVIPIPSPTGSSAGLGESQIVYMLFYVGAPRFTFVWTLFAYNLVVFRRRRGEDTEPTPTPDSTPILLLWAGISFVIVIFLAGWGTFTLHEITSPPHASALTIVTKQVHGQPYKSVLAKPGKQLTIQVIGQEWAWTFRYPSYGGMETKDLVVPVNTPILFHVTSLDVVHSLWIYDYDIKEDAVPGVDNTAWFLAKTLSSYNTDGTNWVKCNELCGMRHGYMKTGLYVRTQANFVQWAKGMESYEKSSGLLKN